MWSNLKQLYKGRSGRILTTIVVLLLLYLTISDLLQGTVTISQTFGTVVVLVIFGAVLFATLWPDGENTIAQIQEKYRLHISAVFALYFLVWAIYVWLTDSGDTLFFYLILSGGLILLIDLLWKLLPTNDTSSTQ